MSILYTENVVQTLARHLGVPVSEIGLTHDLYRDWGFTPLSLVVVLLDLERCAAVELPPEGLTSVRTVADLVHGFRAWVHESDHASSERTPRRARVSRKAQSERRLRRELHHLHWLERQWAQGVAHSLGARSLGARSAAPRDSAGQGAARR